MVIPLSSTNISSTNIREVFDGQVTTETKFFEFVTGTSSDLTRLEPRILLILKEPNLNKSCKIIVPFVDVVTSEANLNKKCMIVVPFVDIATPFILIIHQSSLRTDGTVCSKHSPERIVRECEINIKACHSNNSIF